MGRKTHESIGKPLPGRRNIIVSRNLHYKAKECEVVTSLDQAYTVCKDDERVFNIGGEQLYRQGINDADILIITVLQHLVEGDVFFPEFSETDFSTCTIRENFNTHSLHHSNLSTSQNLSNESINIVVALTYIQHFRYNIKYSGDILLTLPISTYKGGKNGE